MRLKDNNNDIGDIDSADYHRQAQMTTQQYKKTFTNIKKCVY